MSAAQGKKPPKTPPITEKPQLFGSNSNNSNNNSKNKTKKSQKPIIFGDIEDEPIGGLFNASIKTHTILELFELSHYDANLNKTGMRTTLYKFTPPEEYVDESLKGKEIYLKIAFNTKKEALEKEGKINFDLFIDSKLYLNTNKLYVSDFLGYEIYKDKQTKAYVGLFLYKIPEGKTLKQIIENYHKIQKKCSPSHIKSIIDQLIIGLNYIHEHNILHRDIKPENIYVPNDPEAPAYYFDFGESSYIGDNSKNTFLRGTARYAKPNKKVNIAEVLEFQYDVSDDYYALRVSIEEFAANCTKETYDKILEYLDKKITKVLNANMNNIANEINRPELNLYPSGVAVANAPKINSGVQKELLVPNAGKFADNTFVVPANPGVYKPSAPLNFSKYLGGRRKRKTRCRIR